MATLKIHMPPNKDNPDHFFMVVVDSEAELDMLDQWCQETLSEPLKALSYRMGPGSYSYSVGIRDDNEAMLFKMSWS